MHLSLAVSIAKFLISLLFYTFRRGFARACMTALPGLVAVVSFTVYILAVPDATNSASTLFAALIAFNQLRFPLLFYPMALTQLSQAKVSAARLELFLSMKEIGSAKSSNGGVYSRETKTGNGEINLKDAAVYWSDPKIPLISKQPEDSESHSTAKATGVDDLEGTSVEYLKPILSDISFQVPNGELCAVIGRVASGKSSLCSAILGETILSSGEITLKGQIAYAAQSPWILNATIRDNILFGSPFVQEKYDRVIKACQLQHDFEMLEFGDLTEIGERGINLSGGQKQRVSLARAAYSDADTIIMDDPLSALDPEVGQALFDQCITQLMSGKTRLLVTNQLQVLQFCDNIVVLDHGRILEKGSYSHLICKESGEVKRILSDIESEEHRPHDNNEKGEDEDTEKQPVLKETAKQDSPALKTNTGLVTKEERKVGVVSWSVYKKYILAGGGFMRFAIVYIAIVICAANNLANVSWISYWTSDPGYQKNSEAFYLSMYGFLSGKEGVAMIRTDESAVPTEVYSFLID